MNGPRDGRDDRLARFVFEGAAVRGARVDATATARAVLAAHPYPAPLARVLAELVAGTPLLASTLKFSGSLAVQLQGRGPVRLLVVECDHALAVRATAQWDAARVAALPPDATLADLAGEPSDARLVITLDPGDGGPLYQGIVALEHASVAALLEHYLATSEQLASRLALAVTPDAVAGLLLQRMPGAAPVDDATWANATARLAAADPAAVVAAAASDEGLVSLFPGEDLRVFRGASPQARCKCSPARVENALRIAGRDEVEAALAERGDVEVTCEFCGRRYVYGAAEARALFAAAPPMPEPPATRH